MPVPVPGSTGAVTERASRTKPVWGRQICAGGKAGATIGDVGARKWRNVADVRVEACRAEA